MARGRYYTPGGNWNFGENLINTVLAMKRMNQDDRQFSQQMGFKDKELGLLSLHRQKQYAQFDREMSEREANNLRDDIREGKNVDSQIAYRTGQLEQGQKQIAETKRHNIADENPPMPTLISSKYSEDTGLLTDKYEITDRSGKKHYENKHTTIGKGGNLYAGTTGGGQPQYVNLENDDGHSQRHVMIDGVAIPVVKDDGSPAIVKSIDDSGELIGEIERDLDRLEQVYNTEPTIQMTDPKTQTEAGEAGEDYSPQEKFVGKGGQGFSKSELPEDRGDLKFEPKWNVMQKTKEGSESVTSFNSNQMDEHTNRLYSEIQPKVKKLVEAYGLENYYNDMIHYIENENMTIDNSVKAIVKANNIGVKDANRLKTLARYHSFGKK